VAAVEEEGGVKHIVMSELPTQDVLASVFPMEEMVVGSIPQPVLVHT
jgi:hypothetical protein